MFSRAVAVDTAEDPNPRRGRTIGGKREVLSALQRRERERERERDQESGTLAAASLLAGLHRGFDDEHFFGFPRQH
jgi:hypothetical protein